MKLMEANADKNLVDNQIDIIIDMQNDILNMDNNR